MKMTFVPVIAALVCGACATARPPAPSPSESVATENPAAKAPRSSPDPAQDAPQPPVAASLPELAAQVLRCAPEQTTFMTIQGEPTTQLAVGCGQQALFTSAFSGRWMYMGDLRKTAADKLSCPAPELVLSAVTTMRWTVRGCGRLLTYVFSPGASDGALAPEWVLESEAAVEQLSPSK